MDTAQSKVDRLKSLVYDLPEATATEIKVKRLCNNFIKQNFQITENLREEYVNRKLFELRDRIKSNNALRECLSVLATPSKKSSGFLKKVAPYIPFFKYAATFIAWLGSFNSH